MMSRDLKQVLDDDQALSRSLRSLPQASSPGDLTPRLRDVALRARQRRLTERELAQLSRTQRFWRVTRQVHDRLQLTFDNVMRPLAVPVAGGIFAAVTLFGMWVVPAYPGLVDNAPRQTRADIPTPLTTVAKVKPFSTQGTINGDVLLDVTVDDRGRMVDYAIVTAGYAQDAVTRRNLEDLLIRATFVPATAFGRPTRSKVRLWLSSSRIEVKG
jgi:hypothetical protein